MSDLTILYPVAGMVLLTIVIWVHMYVVRVSEAVRAGIRPEEMTPFNPKLPRRIVTSGDNLRNLFELPVLFYLSSVVILVLDLADGAYVTLGWIFLALRCVHSFIHVTYNRIVHRFLAYVCGALVLWVIWVRLSLQLLEVSRP